jgi:hypothetical protein
MYDKKAGSDDPALIVILVDQSSSMSDTYFENRSVAETAKFFCDKIIYQILKECEFEGRIKPRFDFAVIGYGSAIRSAMPKIQIEELPISVTRLPETWIKKNSLVDDEQQSSDNNNDKKIGHLPIPLEWVETISNGATSMLTAFNKTKEIIEEWISNHPKSFPPVVLNITDGMPTDDIILNQRLETGTLGDVTTLPIVIISKEIQKLGTNNGNVLVCNAHVSAVGGNPDAYPISTSGIIDIMAELTFAMSSIIPDELVQKGIERGLSIQRGSRFFIYNADASSLSGFFEFGSSLA